MTHHEDADTKGSYVLGDSGRELDRLSTQARLLKPITRRWLHEAGIGPGMQVLDVGTGTGDVAFIGAELVGDSGNVVGVDQSPAALAIARERADAATLRNVSFREGNLSEMVFEQPFDAVIGRYVLLFQRDPTQMLRKVATHVKPGGLIAFHEPELDARSFPASPTFDQCCRWIVETLSKSGTETHMGIKLYSTFLAAGLPAPALRVDAVLGGGANSHDLVNWAADLVGTLLPAMQRLGIAAPETVAPETLAERMSNEIAASGSVVMRHLEVGAWSRRPA